MKGTNATVTNTHGLLIGAGAVSTATNSYGLSVNAQTGATNNYAAQFAGGNVGIGTTAPSANLHVSPAAAATGTLTALKVTGAANTNQTLSTEIPDLDLNLARTVQWATGALTTQRAVKIQPPTLGFVGASTVTDAATLGITGAPVKGTNATVTNTHGLLIGAGAVSTAANSYGLTVNAQTGATNNYAAQFMGGNVGIGTATPGYPLDVIKAGSSSSDVYAIHAAGTTTNNAAFFGLFIDNLSATDHEAIIGFGAQGTVHWVAGNDAIGNGTDDFYIYGSTIPKFVFYASTAGNVGIGNTAPNTALDVTGFIEWSGQSRVSSTFSKTSSTALAAITGLSATLVAGKTYAFDISLYTTSGVAAGGIQVDLNGGTATATAIIGDAISLDATAVKTQTRVAALNTSLCAVTAVTVANCHITGTITVNVAGTFIPRFAQNASNATASTVAIGSTMILQQIN